MDFFQAVVLGAIQGLTEFLPISSSGHLRVVPALFGWEDPGPAFTAVIQLGTLVAVLAYFRADIVRIGRAWSQGIVRARPLEDFDARMGWMMIVATVPIVVCGLLFKRQIEHELRSLYVVASALIALAVLLAASDAWTTWRLRAGHRQKDLRDVGWTDAAAVGLAQALALVPGSSRSGVTITAGLFAGMTRETAARFSFLLSLPAVLAAGIYEMYSARHELLATSESLMALVVATLVSLVVGYASIAFLLNYLKMHSTALFVIYRLLLGASIFYLLAEGRLGP